MTNYSSSIVLPGGVVLTCSITVPPAAAYPDMGELSEVSQMGVNGLATLVARNAFEEVALDRPSRAAMPFPKLPQPSAEPPV